MNRKTLYLSLAVAGGVLPYVFFIRHFQASGLNLLTFLADAFGNAVASGFATDLIISSIAFWFVMFHRRAAGRGPAPGLFIVLNLAIGLSCALPAYAYATLRERERGSHAEN